MAHDWHMKNKSRSIIFCLCIDDFGVKYFHNHDVDHLINALQQHHKLFIDWERKNYCGFNLQWNYKDHFVDIIMSDYIPTVLKRFQHTKTKPTYTPYKPLCSYNQIRQIAVRPDTSPPLSPPKKTKVQQIIGCLLYYARAFDNTMLVALNTNSPVTKRSNSTHSRIMSIITRLLCNISQCRSQVSQK